MQGNGDYISSDAARNALFIGEQCLYSWDEIDEKLDAIPAADVVPLDYHERCLQIEVEKRLALELQMPRWIPVTERLPEAGDHVLVYAGFFQPFNEVSYIDAEGKWRFAYDDTEVPIVTHWMPLPSTEGLNET